MRRFLLLVMTAVILIGGCDRGDNPNLVGKQAPDFRVQDEDRSVALSNFRGQVVMLNFWASWCPPCVEETPSMIAMQEQMRGRITILAVSTDADRDAYLKFLREEKTNFLTVRDGEQKSNRLYGTTAFPETYIIDREGVVRRKFIGPVDWTKPDIIQYLSSL
jgi:peroxiredoxin